jgi:hypothetical protein
MGFEKEKERKKTGGHEEKVLILYCDNPDLF